jgi:histone acetyltransferase HTATIP/histone acetyltransferase MYST1
LSTPSLLQSDLLPYQDPLFTSLRTIETTANEDGSATSHVIVRCTLGDIARATNLRVEDAAFALGECGLLRKRCGVRDLNGEEGEGEGEGEGDVVVSREMVEAVARERRVKKTMMDLMHVLL